MEHVAAPVEEAPVRGASVPRRLTSGRKPLPEAARDMHALLQAGRSTPATEHRVSISHLAAVVASTPDGRAVSRTGTRRPVTAAAAAAVATPRVSSRAQSLLRFPSAAHDQGAQRTPVLRTTATAPGTSRSMPVGCSAGAEARGSAWLPGEEDRMVSRLAASRAELLRSESKMERIEGSMLQPCISKVPVKKVVEDATWVAIMAARKAREFESRQRKADREAVASSALSRSAASRSRLLETLRDAQLQERLRGSDMEVSAARGIGTLRHQESFRSTLSARSVGTSVSATLSGGGGGGGGGGQTDIADGGSLFGGVSGSASVNTRGQAGGGRGSAASVSPPHRREAAPDLTSGPMGTRLGNVIHNLVAPNTESVFGVLMPTTPDATFARRRTFAAGRGGEAGGIPAGLLHSLSSTLAHMPRPSTTPAVIRHAAVVPEDIRRRQRASVRRVFVPSIHDALAVRDGAAAVAAVRDAAAIRSILADALAPDEWTGRCIPGPQPLSRGFASATTTSDQPSSLAQPAANEEVSRVRGDETSGSPATVGRRLLPPPVLVVGSPTLQPACAPMLSSNSGGVTAVSSALLSSPTAGRGSSQAAATNGPLSPSGKTGVAGGGGGVLRLRRFEGFNGRMPFDGNAAPNAVLQPYSAASMATSLTELAIMREQMKSSTPMLGSGSAAFGASASGAASFGVDSTGGDEEEGDALGRSGGARRPASSSMGGDAERASLPLATSGATMSASGSGAGASKRALQRAASAAATSRVSAVDAARANAVAAKRAREEELLQRLEATDKARFMSDPSAGVRALASTDGASAIAGKRVQWMINQVREERIVAGMLQSRVETAAAEARVHRARGELIAQYNMSLPALVAHAPPVIAEMARVRGDVYAERLQQVVDSKHRHTSDKLAQALRWDAEREELAALRVRKEREMTWMLVVTLSFVSNRLLRSVTVNKMIRSESRLAAAAATRIQRNFRGRRTRVWLANMRQARPALSKLVWRWKLQRAIQHKRAAAGLIQRFTHELVEPSDSAHRATALRRYIRYYRLCIIKAQRYVRAFLVCLRARRLALKRLWQRAVTEQQRLMHKLSALERLHSSEIEEQPIPLLVPFPFSPGPVDASDQVSMSGDLLLTIAVPDERTESTIRARAAHGGGLPSRSQSRRDLLTEGGGAHRPGADSVEPRDGGGSTAGARAVSWSRRRASTGDVGAVGGVGAAVHLDLPATSLDDSTLQPPASAGQGANARGGAAMEALPMPRMPRRSSLSLGLSNIAAAAASSGRSVLKETAAIGGGAAGARSLRTVSSKRSMASMTASTAAMTAAEEDVVAPPSAASDALFPMPMPARRGSMPTVLAPPSVLSVDDTVREDVLSIYLKLRRKIAIKRRREWSNLMARQLVAHMKDEMRSQAAAALASAASTAASKRADDIVNAQPRRSGKARSGAVKSSDTASLHVQTPAAGGDDALVSVADVAVTMVVTTVSSPTATDAKQTKMQRRLHGLGLYSGPFADPLDFKLLFAKPVVKRKLEFLAACNALDTSGSGVGNTSPSPSPSPSASPVPHAGSKVGALRRGAAGRRGGGGGGGAARKPGAAAAAPPPPQPPPADEESKDTLKQAISKRFFKFKHGAKPVEIMADVVSGFSPFPLPLYTGHATRDLNAIVQQMVSENPSAMMPMLASHNPASRTAVAVLAAKRKHEQLNQSPKAGAGKAALAGSRRHDGSWRGGVGGGSNKASPFAVNILGKPLVFGHVHGAHGG